MTSDITLPPEPKPITMGKPYPRLLVVGDQPTYKQTLPEIFHRDHDVLAAGNGVQAFEICHNSLPDLILLDVVMPGTDGLEICRQLKADPDTKGIPVILLIAQDSPEAETKALAAGAVDFITKPVNPAVARARVNTHLTLKAQSDLLQSPAFVDGLTGVASQHRFNEGIEAEWRRCRRLITPLALFMIDIDNFNKYNACHGRPAADACLQEVAAILKGQIGRSHDLLARHCDGKFACLLPDVYFDGALQKAEAMVRAVRDRGLPHAASETASVVTISMGVVATIPGPDRQPSEFISAVEAQLHKAKQQGRNQVCGQELEGYFSNSLK
ncbi:MAG: diguanylate cyclase [Desulfatirhabdiaceae bacterium]|nr:diguanylate cyclase [Desulfatirhabdiaceae bacterium]